VKSTKNGIITLVVEINLREELVLLKKIYWILYHQPCDHLVIVPSVPEVDHLKMVCQNKDMLRQEVALNVPLMTLTFMLDK
jgi:hypothetical protein